MNYKLILALDNILGKHQQQGQDEYYWPCPFCSSIKPKLAINIKKGYHCWVCSASGRKITGLLRKLDCPVYQIHEIASMVDEGAYIHTPVNDEVIPLTLPQEYKPLYIPDTSREYKEAIQYLRGRHITVADILKHKIGYCTEGEYRERIIVPSYDNTGKLNYFVSRLIYENDRNRQWKYKNPKTSKNVIIFENHVNWKYPVTFVEGVFDAFAIKRNVIPLLGKTMSPKLQEKLIEEKVKDIYIALDKDAQKEVLRTAKKLMENGVNVYIVSLDEKDPSLIGFELMTKHIKEAKVLTFKDFIRLRVA